MDGCVFCKIVTGEIPAKVVAETTGALAFHDVNPAQPIHVLVVPKKHYSDIADLTVNDEESLVEVMKLGAAVADQLSAGSFRFQFNTGAEAGQTVFHAHGHITSRTPRA
jgi:histidine triad (HIT) family protein